MTRIQARLREMLDAIQRIESYVRPGRDEFFANELIHSSVLYRLGSLGESAKGIPSPFRDRHPEIGWKQITGIRDIVNHKYYGVDLESVWATVERDLPPLKAQLLDLLASDPELQE